MFSGCPFLLITKVRYEVFLDTREQSHPGMVQNSWDKYFVFKGMAIAQSETIMIMAKAGLYGYGPMG